MTPDEERRETILCDMVHGTMKAAYFKAQAAGVPEDVWEACLEGARTAMEIEANYQIDRKNEPTLRRGQQVEMPDGTWKVLRFCDEPNTGLVVMEPVEPLRGVNVVAPVDWILPFCFPRPCRNVTSFADQVSQGLGDVVREALGGKTPSGQNP